MYSKPDNDINLLKLKLCLNIELKNDNGINISIITIKDDILKRQDSGMYQDFTNDFTVWRYSEFMFDERQLRLPERKHLVYGKVIKKFFPNNNSRKKTLKKLYNALHMWSKVNSDFNDKGKVIIDGKYWCVY